MATRAVFRPYDAEFPTTNFPQLLRVNARPVLAFDAATQEACYWALIWPQGMTGTISLVLSYMMASATTGAVVMESAVEAVTDGDATDLDAGDSFDSDNESSSTTVPGTAGYIDQVSITLTNADSVAVGDYVRLRLRRDPANAGDTASGDLYLLAAELRDGA